MNNKDFLLLNQKIISCKKCPRLIRYINSVAKTKVRRYSNQKYWGKPISGFGDYSAKLLVIGLAPAAHGGNRTGRMFTGDSSGDWLTKALFENKFANQKSSENIDDGLKLKNVYVTASIRCAPPKNKPTKVELDNCSNYLITELLLLEKIKVILCLGKIAFEACCRVLEIKHQKFSHGLTLRHSKYIIICSYHPSRQNTQTGRLKWNQWNSIFKKARKLCA